MKGIIPGKYCVYLDQFAVSNLVDDHPDWLGIKELLQYGVLQNILVCPVPYEHFLETASKEDQNALLHNDFLTNLSGGYYFKSEPFITAQLLISSVRNYNITANTFLSTKLDPNFSFAKSIDKFRGYRKNFSSMINEIEEAAGPIKKIQRGKKINPKVDLQMMAAVRALDKFEFCDRLKELNEKKGIVIRAVNFQALAVPHWIDYLLDALLKVNKMSSAEGKLLWNYVNRNGFDRISTMDVRTTLNAYTSVKHKKQTSNDQLDIMRIGTAIQISDIMFIDKARKYELIETGLDKKYDVELFNGTKQDLQQCEQMLKSILA